ncbi:MAG: hypothetical protein AAGC65_12430 [Mucilaginibacter sp.]|uniref:hypothetical protein n=1 Tax=Mucilaginibacter sp. TaxID=1882438 RepID=UPI0031A79031
MNKIYTRRLAVSSPTQKVVLTAEAFLAKYLNRETLLNFIDKGRIDDVEEFSAFFDLLKQGREYAFPRKKREDKGRNPYKYASFLGTGEGCKVMLIGNMENFILDYTRKLCTIDFTLEELIEQAEK